MKLKGNWLEKKKQANPPQAIDAEKRDLSIACDGFAQNPVKRSISI